ncbi:rab3 gtpase-activating protein catalytic [Plasmopara halstedii]|uniref:Rab3 GTPase-activating protein catalytic subunit n=1 Tax=Plasmopara halstedii TaxID=4781 RepID=A0A0P1AAH4_PLAHL|nr:rab3 gtpase-activating protein catalytic [Plasmopara halstedii]CEG37388.1 rab3 gtpase-activating protein catalytic [Plasmopara halstedii]|eukprot:XP_024573757.1 rab3 gtpase-activating protein catalytic [Plasmopara halstedii]
MQVEEDPSSQFVDFTNATATEQFVSDLEQALIGWHLASKGHASLEALGPHLSPNPVDTAVWTKELKFQPFGGKRAKNYTLSLFVVKRQTESEIPTTFRKPKIWLQGLEHFTPTMLSVADASCDFQWDVKNVTEFELKESERRSKVLFLRSEFDESESWFDRKNISKNMLKWFGVDEYILLGRSPIATVSATAAHDSSEIGNGSNPAKDEMEKQSIESGNIIADVYIDQNEAGMLLSALTMALNNCNCTMPAFVPVLEPSRGMLIGSAIPGSTGNVSLEFDTDSVPELNPNQSCISGLLDFFKAKLQLSPQVEDMFRVESAKSRGDVTAGMTVSASFGYSWNRKDDPREIMTSDSSLAWRTIDSQFLAKDHDQIRQMTSYLFGKSHSTPILGTISTPLEGMDLTVSWPQLCEGTYVDNVVHSTLDPSSAPQWMLNVRFEEVLSENERKPQLALSKRMANLVQVYSNSRELNKDMLVSELAPPMPIDLSSTKLPGSLTTSSASRSTNSFGNQASMIIPESIPAARGAAVVLSHAISSLVSAATWKGSDAENIRQILLELFGDGETSSDEENRDSNCDMKRKEELSLMTLPSPVQHGAPLGELVSILATRMTQLHGINSMSLLWVEFVKALRKRWFQLQLLPFMSTSTKENGDDQNSGSHSLDALFLLDTNAMRLPPPDFRHCLLHQKLQLLNCCIMRKAQESKPGSIADIKSNTEKGMSELFTDQDGGDENLSDDEFFDSIEQESVPMPSPPRTRRHPEGVLCEATGIVCLHTNEPLFEPVTQSAVPMTEDVARQQQDLLTRLGVSIESDRLRQHIQSTTLVSDMQAFKAANPRCCLTDFIRWYSPKDWISFENPIDPTQTELPQEGRGIWWFEEHGMLSERMRFGPGHEHIWQQLWESCVAMPASRQKPLFDPLQESEKVFHYMETLSPHELFHQMLAGAISSSVFALETALPVHISAENSPVIYCGLENLRSHASRAIAMLDEALAESQMAFSAASSGKQQIGEGQEQSMAAAHQQIQVAFEMALDACWKFVLSLEAVEAMVTKTLALLHYFPMTKDDHFSLELINLLLLPVLSHRQRLKISELLEQKSLRQQVSAIVLAKPSVTETGSLSVIPIQREYVLRCVCPRPFLREYYDNMALDDEDDEMNSAQPVCELEASPLVICRMYAAFKKSTVRFAHVLAESEF